MKVWILLITSVACGVAGRLISEDEIQSLFVKFVKNNLTHDDNRTFEDVVELLQHTTPITKDNLDMRRETRDTIDCIVCRSAFAALFEGVKDGLSDEQLTETITVLCYSLGIESYKVCLGAVKLNMPVLTHIVRTTPAASPNTFCSLIQQRNEDNRICPLTDARFEWTVELPEPQAPVPTRQPTSINHNLKIALISDAHIDPLYAPNSVAVCDEPTCCRPGQTPRSSFKHTSFISENLLDNSLVKKDGVTYIDLDTAGPIRKAKLSSSVAYNAAGDTARAGYWGDYRKCDTPIWAFDNVIDEITDKHKDIDIVYYIGDSIDHHVWETDYDQMNAMHKHVIEKIREGFGDTVRVVPAIGNHESQPTNQFAPSSVTGPYINTTWLYESLAKKWQFYLPEDALQTLRDRGVFSLLVAPGLRVISINNNIAYRYNWWLVYDPQDSKRHLEWLVDELHKAEEAGEKVHILAHIPAGVNDLTYVWTREYNRVINRFSATIAAELTGHTHADELKVFYSADDQPALVSWGAGGATSYADYNLNYKILTVDARTYGLTNIQNYIYNLTEANLTPHRKPHWFQLYDFKQRFGVTDLSPASIDDLLYSMVTKNKALLDVYSVFFYKLSDTRTLADIHGQRLDNLCKAVITVLWERDRCQVLRRLFDATS